MSGRERSKGARGERELAHLLQGLTGCPVVRRVRNAAGDSDLVGLVTGPLVWSVECKRYAAAAPGDVARWWRQAAEQALREGGTPLLCWRADRMADWRFHWPAALHCDEVRSTSADVSDTLSADPLTWWRVVRALIRGSFPPLPAVGNSRPDCAAVTPQAQGGSGPGCAGPSGRTPARVIRAPLPR